MNRPNILWYCTDQQRFDTIGALGNPYVKTPVVDKLVQRGVSFTHTYCQSPICTPSRSSFMTGLYPTRAHNTRNGNDTFPEWPPLISRLIADSGYHCGLIGKFHLVSAGKRPEPRLDDGFEQWWHSHAPRDDWPDGTHDYADWVRKQGKSLDEMRVRDERVDPEYHQTKWASDRAIEFIDGHQQQGSEDPWMLVLNVYDPHPPFIPPKAYADQFSAEDMPGPHFKDSDLDHQAKLKRVDFQGGANHPDTFEGKDIQARYYAMIKQIDDQLKRIIDSLEASGQLDNTIIIFTSDHGEALGDHGLVQKGCRFYEGLVRVPLIFSCPGMLKENVQCDGLVEMLDLSATLLDYAGVEIPEYHQGISLRPYLEGKEDGKAIRESVRCEYFDALDPYFVKGNGSYATMYRTPEYKLSVYHDQDMGELYDLTRDPWEHADLWDHPEYQAIKYKLLEASFNSHVLLTTDVGSERIAPM